MRLIAAGLGMLLWTSALVAQAASPFPPQRDARFRHARAALEALAAQAKAQGPQQFCVVAYPQGGEAIAWVHWSTAKRLVLWEPTTGDERRFDLVRSRRNLDLTQDVRKTDAEVGTSTYLVTQAWVDQITRDCARRGQTLRLTARSRATK
jgi:hypothetical protein